MRSQSGCDVASDESAGAYGELRDRWFERLLGPEREPIPASYHMAYMRRLSPLEATYTKERSVEVCMETLSRSASISRSETSIRLDLDDRPQKSPRACVIASDPPTVVHLITRAQGGLHDYQAFLHEAGHALHYAGCDPELPYTFRKLSRDHALTEIYSYILEAISREPGWHAELLRPLRRRGGENAEATIFLEALLYRRYAAKLRFELDFWARFDEDGGTPDGYAERLGEATGSGTAPTTTSRTWTPASTRPTTCAPGSALRSCATHLIGRGRARTGGGHRRPASCCARSSAKGRARRARRSPLASASIRSTRHRSSPSFPRRVRECLRLPSTGSIGTTS